TVDRRDVVLSGSRYRRVIVPQCRSMPPATLRKLVDLASDGAVVIFESALPTDAPGWADSQKRRDELRVIRQGIESGKSEPTTDPDLGKWMHVGKGGIGVGGKLERAMMSVWEIARGYLPRREFMAFAGLRFIRRETSDGFVFFIVNASDKAVAD